MSGNTNRIREAVGAGAANGKALAGNTKLSRDVGWLFEADNMVTKVT
jgi:hypothetical protein